jgi:hypothetical protein
MTLNRLNESTLKSAARETKMRSRILECKKELAVAIREMDLVNENLFATCQKRDIKTDKLQKLRLKN